MTKIMRILCLGGDSERWCSLTDSLTGSSLPSIEHRHSARFESLSESVAAYDPHLVFLDLNGAASPEWSHAFSVNEKLQGKPLVVFASANPPGALMSLFDQNDLGAVVEPDLDANSLGAVISQLMDRSRLVNKLIKNAMFDPLTSLPGHDLFQDRLRTAVHRVGRLGFGFGLAFCDIDGMSAVNKRYGYDIGDQIFRQIAIRFRERMRKSDTTARLGGDLFALIFENVIYEKTLNRLAEKIHAAISEPYKVVSDERGEEFEVSLQFSFGMCLFPHHLTEPDLLIPAVERALKEAKTRGGHQVVIFDPENHGDEMMAPIESA